MFIAVMVDMRAGIRKARALKLPIDSHGLRRTFTKFGDYGKVTALFMCVDVLGLLFGIWSMPYASAVSAVIAVCIEAWSVRRISGRLGRRQRRSATSWLNWRTPKTPKILSNCSARSTVRGKNPKNSSRNETFYLAGTHLFGNGPKDEFGQCADGRTSPQP